MTRAQRCGSHSAVLLFGGLALFALALLPAKAAGDDEPAPARDNVQQRLLIAVDYLPNGGARVARIDPGSPALSLKRADNPGEPFQILIGDVITEVNGVDVTSPEVYAEALNSRPGRATLTIIDGRTREVDRWVCETVAVHQRLGVNLRYLDDGGVRVTAIDPGSPVLSIKRADNPGAPFSLRVGEVIKSINGMRVFSPESYAEALNRRSGTAILRVVDSVTGETDDWISGTIAELVDNDEPPQRPREEEDRRRVAWVLLIALTDDEKIGKNMALSLSQLADTFKADVDTNRLRLKTISGSDCNRRNILQEVDNLNPADDDTIFVYYMGHGGYDPRIEARDGDPLAAHFFSMDLPGFRDERDDLARRELTRALRAKPGRLKILFSDTCNTAASLIVAKPGNGHTVAQTRTETIRGLMPLEKLLFGFGGWLDVSASSKGQYSWSNPSDGGLFTQQFASLTSSTGEWSTFLSRLSTNSNESFQQRRKYILEHPDDVKDDVLEAMRGQEEMIPEIIENLRADLAEADAQDRRERTRTVTYQLFIPD